MITANDLSGALAIIASQPLLAQLPWAAMRSRAASAL